MTPEAQAAFKEAGCWLKEKAKEMKAKAEVKRWA